MPGNASFPNPGDQTEVPGGRDDDIRSSVGSKVSAAKFVDNSVHHAIYEISTDSSTRRYMSLSRPKNSDFQVTLPKQYDYTERDSTLLLSHTIAPGVENNTPVFFNDTKLLTGSTPPILLFGGKSRISTGDITTETKGSKIALENMGGLALVDLGLEPGISSLAAGQIVDVGLRTTDLVMKLFKDKMHGINSISVGIPFAGSRAGTVSTHKGSSLFHHSTQFLSRDFNSVSIPNAIRYVARASHYLIYTDRFGNFIFAPDGFAQTDRTVEGITSDDVSYDPIVDAANRVIVTGSQYSLNSDNEAHIDDGEAQKRDGVVKTQRVNDPTAKTRTAARASARNFLRLNKKAQAAINTSGHINSWDLEPGSVVNYKQLTGGRPVRAAVIETNHYMTTGKSDFLLLSYQTGVEGVFNTIDMDKQTVSERDSVFSDNTISKVDYSMVGKSKLRGRGFLKMRKVASSKVRSHSTLSGTGAITLDDDGVEKHSGFILGHRGYEQGASSGRSAIGTGLTPHLTGGSFSSTTITVPSTTGFPTTGTLIVDETSYVTYSGKTSTTFTGVSLQAGPALSSSGLTVRLLRTRGHEVGTVKSKVMRRKL